MRLIYYCDRNQADNQCQPTAQILKQGLPSWRVMIYEDLKEVAKTLRSPLGSHSLLVVLCLNSQSEVDFILQQRELLKGLELVLILPEEPGGMGAKTWLLEPRISFYGLPSGHSLCAILQKMADRLATRPQLGSVDRWQAPPNIDGIGFINEEL